MKCSKCGEDKLSEDFYPYQKNICKACLCKANLLYSHTHRESHCKSARLWYQNHKESCRKAGRLYYQNHRERLRKASLLRQHSHPEVVKAYQHKKTRKFKEKVLTYYGNGKCAYVKCGFDDIRALSIDHKMGGGVAHYKSMKARNIYRWLANNDYPEGYQTLCMNCQWIKRAENDENRKRVL